MEHFLDTQETIAPGYGFEYYSSYHLGWLLFFVLCCAAGCFVYRRADKNRRTNIAKAMALLIVLDEVFKISMLMLGGNFLPKYLPFHLCSINIFLIAYHAVRPNAMLGNFLYTACLPGACAALLFPTWDMLPTLNFMHLHSFTIHILLAAYPLILTAGGDIKPDAKYILPSVGLLLVMAVPIYAINLLLDTNFMFLMYPEPGSPLLIFKNLWGNHLLGFPVLISAVLLVMHLPPYILRKIRMNKHD